MTTMWALGFWNMRSHIDHKRVIRSVKRKGKEMAKDGRAPSGQAPATPANAVDGPTGFDPSRLLKDLGTISHALEAAWAAVDELADDADLDKDGECEESTAGYGPLCALGTGNVCWCDRAGCLIYKLRAIDRAKVTIEYWRAIATEARSAETGTGSVREGAGRRHRPSPVEAMTKDEQ